MVDMHLALTLERLLADEGRFKREQMIHAIQKYNRSIKADILEGVVGKEDITSFKQQIKIVRAITVDLEEELRQAN